MLPNSDTILVIDDNPLILLNYSEIIDSSGYICITATMIKQAMNLIRLREVGLIICDHDLPDGKGIDLVQYVLDSGIEIPFVYISAAITDVLTQASSFSLVKDVLVKPVSHQVLISTIHKYLSHTTNSLYPRLIGQQERYILLNELSA